MPYECKLRGPSQVTKLKNIAHEYEFNILSIQDSRLKEKTTKASGSIRFKTT